MQPLAQEIAKARITGAEKMEIAFCPWAVLAFRAWASKTRQFQRKEKWLDRCLFWPCATNFMFQHVMWQTDQHFIIGEDFSSSRIKTKGCIIREIEVKKHSEIFFKKVCPTQLFGESLDYLTVSEKKRCTVSNVSLCITKTNHTNQNPPKPGGMRGRKGWFLTYPSTLPLPLSNLAQRDSWGT